MSSSTATLKMLLLGEDRSASDSLKRVGKTLDKTSGQVKHFGDTSDQQTKKASGSFKHVAGVMTGAFTGAAVFGFLKDSVQGWSDHEKVLRQSAAVIKSTGGAAGITAKQMDDLSGSIESNTGVDGDNVLAGENMLATFTNIHNQQGKGNDIFTQATKIMTDMSVSMGTDMKGQAIQLGKALNDPIHGVGALSKVGVTFTEQQKKQIATMVEAGNTAGAQRVILHELSKEFGGSAKAQETSGQKMAVAFHNLQDTIGQALVPVITKLAAILTNDVLPVVQTVINFITAHKDVFVLLATVITTAVVAWKSFALVSAIVKGAMAAYAVVMGLFTASTEAATVAQTELDAAMDANPIGIVVVAIAALAAGLIYAYKHSETFRRVVQTAWTVIKTYIMAVWNYYLKPMFTAWKTVILALGATAMWLWRNAIQPAWNGIRAVISAAWNDVIKPVASAIRSAFHGISDGLRAAWTVITTIFGYIKTGIRAVRDVVKTVGKATSGFFKGIGNGLEWVWSHTIGPIVDAIISKIQQAIDLYNTLTGKGVHKGGTATGGPSGFSGGGGTTSSGGGRHAARAGGGRVLAGMTYLVGEERPELFSPDRNGTIVPRVGAGGDVHVNVTIQGITDKHGAALEIRQALLGLKRTLRSDLGLT